MTNILSFKHKVRNQVILKDGAFVLLLPKYGTNIEHNDARLDELSDYLTNLKKYLSNYMNRGFADNLGNWSGLSEEVL